MSGYYEKIPKEDKMKTLTLKIEDSAVDKEMWFLGHLKYERISS
jgi:hypothetical protein